jgi:uncharacterized protein (DUF1330 family)
VSSPFPYKRAAKAVTNHLRGCLDKIISEEQSAFVPGHTITDNVVVAFESVHAVKRRNKGKNFSCAVKIDMMKAYDRVEWHYLEVILLKLGFSINIVRLIMKCVTSVRFAVRVNGQLLPFFTPSLGLHQGDPMSPYLFLLYAESFTSLLKFFGGNYVDRGIRVSFQSPWINHLLFADDSLIFISANIHSALRLNDKVNRNKSVGFFTPNTTETARMSMKNGLGIMVEAFTERYLGLPT